MLGMLGMKSGVFHQRVSKATTRYLSTIMFGQIGKLVSTILAVANREGEEARKEERMRIWGMP